MRIVDEAGFIIGVRFLAGSRLMNHFVGGVLDAISFIKGSLLIYIK